MAYDDAEPLHPIPFVIANGQSVSAAVDLANMGAIRLFMPAAWDAAAVTVLLSSDGITYSPYYDDNGEYAVPNAAAARACWLDPGKWVGMRFVQLRSGTVALAVNQTAQRTLLLVARPL